MLACSRTLLFPSCQCLSSASPLLRGVPDPFRASEPRKEGTASRGGHGGEGLRTPSSRLGRRRWAADQPGPHLPRREGSRVFGWFTELSRRQAPERGRQGLRPHLSTLKHSKYLPSAFSLGSRPSLTCLDPCPGAADNSWLEVLVLPPEGVQHGRGHIRHRGEGCTKERISRTPRTCTENFNLLGS